MSLHGRIAQIHRSAFAHPEDGAALEALASVPILPEVQKVLSKTHAEHRFHVQARMGSIRLGRAQFPSLYRMVCSAAETLGIATPEAYLSNQPQINAFAFGMDRFTITLTSELVDVLSDREIEAIVAHELGHVVCEHMLHRSVGAMLASPLCVLPRSVLGPVNAVLHGALMRWSRAAEYSADRVALLVTGDPEQVASALGRLAAPTRRFAHEYNAQEMLAQDVETPDASFFTKLTLFGEELFRTHPEPVQRVRAIMDWSNSEQYHAILAGRFLTRAEYNARNRIQIQGVKHCANCGAAVGHLANCPDCGMTQDPARQAKCVRQHVNDMAWKFCRACGGAVNAPGISD